MLEQIPDPPAATPDLIHQAVAALRAGALVGMPTETVYGLAADASNPEAVARIFALKGRPNDHPVIVHIAGSAQLACWAVDIPAAAYALTERFWPGPLTLILRRARHVLDAVTGGQDTVGLRAPAHPMARTLLEQFGGGLAAPSANRFGRVSPTSAAHVRAEFGADLPLVLDGGACTVGVESTIIGLTGPVPTLLRPGGIPAEAIEAVLGCRLVSHQHADSARMRVSGLLDAHYAPRTPLLTGPRPQLLLRLAQLQAIGSRVVVLSRSTPADWPVGVDIHPMPTNPTDYARHLYASLRALDGQGYSLLLLEIPPPTPDWLAVNDRLRRAATECLHDEGLGEEVATPPLILPPLDSPA